MCISKSFFITLILFLISTYNFGCSTFMLKNSDSLIVGHNLDFTSDYVPGHIFINKRGIAKTNDTINYEKGKREGAPGIGWVSKYGSVTFNDGTIEIGVNDGINEVGLFIAHMELDETRYPTGNSIPHMVMGQ